MRQIPVIISVIIIVMMNAGFPSAEAEMQIESIPAPSIGDFYIYQEDITHLANSIGRDVGEENFTEFDNIYKENSEYRFTSVASISVNGTSYQTMTIITSYAWKFTLKFKPGTTDFDDDKIDYLFSFSGTTWLDLQTYETVKSSNTNIVVIEYSLDGDEKKIEWETIEVTELLSIEGIEPLPLKTGMNWTITKMERVNTTEKDRYDGGEWAIYSYEEIENTATDFQVVSENEITVPAGTFTCLNVKEQDRDDESYTSQYVDENEMLIKLQYHEDDGSILITGELKDFKYKNGGYEDENDDEFEIFGINGFYVIFGSAFLVAAVSAVGYIMNKREEDVEGIEGVEAIEEEWGTPVLNTIAVQRPMIKGPPVQYGPTPGNQIQRNPAQRKPRPICSRCRSRVRFMPEYKMHYCYTCQDYVRPLKPRPRPAPSCHFCGGKLQYISDYSSWYCNQCGQYAT